MLQNASQERVMRDDDFIVSKTDPKGKITYGNRTFIEFSGFNEKQLLAQPHNVIRHPDMLRAVFRLLWNTLQDGKEFFGLIKNLSKNGKFYWTFAHVTPSYDLDGALLGYYSVRRCPQRDSIACIEPVYQQMRDLEDQQDSAKQAMDTSIDYLNRHISTTGKSYNEFILSLEQ